MADKPTGDPCRDSEVQQQWKIETKPARDANWRVSRPGLRNPWENEQGLRGRAEWEVAGRGLGLGGSDKSGVAPH